MLDFYVELVDGLICCVCILFLILSFYRAYNSQYARRQDTEQFLRKVKLLKKSFHNNLHHVDNLLTCVVISWRLMSIDGRRSASYQSWKSKFFSFEMLLINSLLRYTIYYRVVLGACYLNLPNLTLMIQIEYLGQGSRV